MLTIEGDFDVPGSRYAVVATRWNDHVVDRLLDAALEVLAESDIADDDITVVRVPGAFELPLMCDRLADSGDYDAIIALGVVIRGETPHFDYICAEAAKGITNVALEYGVPVTFGVITADTPEQADDRSQPGEENNKGTEAASAAVEMVSILRQLSD